jgi:hypothetical protein
MSDAYENLEGDLNTLLDDSIERINRHTQRNASILKKTADALNEEAELIKHLDMTAKYARECRHVLLQNLMQHLPPPHQLEAEDPLPRIAQPYAQQQEEALSRVTQSLYDDRHPFMKRIA